VTGVQFSRYNANDALVPLLEVGAAIKSRSLAQFYEVKEKYFESDEFFAGDIVTRKHLPKMEDKILKSNLVRVLEPYSVCDLQHISSLIEGASVQLVEKKLGVMILDGVIDATIDQGQGCIIMNEEKITSGGGKVAENSVKCIAEVGKIVETLQSRGQRELR